MGTAQNTLGGRIGIVGAGAMGTMLGARLYQAGLNVELIDADQAQVDALKTQGATVVGTVSWSVRVRAFTPETVTGQYDLVFLLTKQTHNATVFGQLEPHLHRRSLVCTLQNGVPEPAVAAALGAERTLGAAVTWASTYLAPGKVESTADPQNWRTLLGAVDERTAGSMPEVRDVLSILCPCEIVSDLAGVRWSKLLMNAAFSGMSAALGCTFGELLDDEKALACVQHVARESVRVSKARGVRMARLWPEVDFGESIDFDSEAERLEKVDLYRELGSPVMMGKASMLQDLEAGRMTEIDYINGFLSRTGREVGVPTPVSDMVVRVVKSIERGERAPSFTNLEFFTLPLE